MYYDFGILVIWWECNGATEPSYAGHIGAKEIWLIDC